MRMSSASTELVRYIVRATIDGVMHDPTELPVAFAFSDGTTPVSGDFAAGEWVTEGSTYIAQVLVGPVGGIDLGPGLWAPWIKVTDDPEVPVVRLTSLAIV